MKCILLAPQKPRDNIYSPQACREYHIHNQLAESSSHVAEQAGESPGVTFTAWVWLSISERDLVPEFSDSTNCSERAGEAAAWLACSLSFVVTVGAEFSLAVPARLCDWLACLPASASCCCSIRSTSISSSRFSSSASTSSCCINSSSFLALRSSFCCMIVHRCSVRCSLISVLCWRSSLAATYSDSALSYRFLQNQHHFSWVRSQSTLQSATWTDTLSIPEMHYASCFMICCYPSLKGEEETSTNALSHLLLTHWPPLLLHCKS